MRRDVIGRVAPWVQMNWDWRAAGNFLGGGTGTGLLIAAAIASVEPAGRAILLGMVCVGAGLSCVWAEIGRPWRALNVFRHARTSWMTREAFVGLGLFACGAAALAGGGAAARASLALFAAAFLYCQARMLQAAKGIPAWRHPRVIPLVLVTGLAEGAGLLLLCAALRVLDPPAAWFMVMLAVLLLARIACWIAYRRGVGHGGAPRAALAVLDSLGPRLVAVDLTASLLAGASLWPAAGDWPRGLAAALALAGGWILKYSILRRAAFNQGFALVLGPERGVGGPTPPVRPGWEQTP
jgi:phenylacetyl-CoA:acceptor oxidoreductase subunit 2